MSLFLDLLREHLGPDYPLSEWQYGNLEAHFNLLWRWKQKINLTAVQDVEELVVHHYCESIALGSIIPLGKHRIMDVGSGAGFPGIPLMIARPDCFVLLVESDGRKSIFLREATLDLPNSLVFRTRVEQMQQGCDWMVSRAIRWSDLIPSADRLAAHLALLVTSDTADQAAMDFRLRWREPIPLPWGERKVILIGDV